MKHHIIRTFVVLTMCLLSTVAKGEDMAGYLFAYFRGNATTQEHLFYAFSSDGLNYTPINGGNAVVNFSGISVTGNIRDPFVLRGEDGTFYMVCTDMRSSNGWDSNRGIVMSKSTDLVNWTHSTVHFPTKYAGTDWANVTHVWAPEVIYDRTVGKYMVYFALKTGNNAPAPYDKQYYCYANSDFTDLEGEPTHLYDRGSATIDLTIAYNDEDGLYHGFYKNEGAGGICHITCSSLTAATGAATGSQWSTPSGTVQQTSEAVEGPSIFKRISDGKWILGYDCYAANPAHFQLCEVSNNFTTFTKWGDCANHGAFTPRHGSIIPLTNTELYDLDIAFGGASDLSALKSELQKELTLASTFGLSMMEEQAVYNNTKSNRLQIQNAINNLKVKEYNYVSTNYTYDASMLLGNPATNNIVTNSSQHWDGTNASTYFEQSGSSWGASSWTSSMTYTTNLPVGEYVFCVACRAASNVSGTISGNGSTAIIPTNGDVGYGITTTGVTSFSSSDTFTNGNNGRGWEWRYIPVSVTGSSKEITFTITASTNTIHQWYSVTNIALLSKGYVAPEVVSDEQNSTTTRTQVTTNVNITTAIDYKITGATPFTTTGSINIANDNATVIFSSVKPSAVINSWLPYIKINGSTAVNGTNCQVKIYGDGAIILPHGDSFYPLVVYQGNEWTGIANNKYYPKTKYNLAGTTFDNSIRSFTLRRGYSVCLSAKANGLGYSRIWVADTRNIKVDLAGTPLDGTVSFIRINKWNDTSKKGWAGGQATQNNLLNTTWYYNWNDNGELNSADREYVGIRQQPWWPNPDQASSNTLGYNEFDNTVEDSYKKLVEIAGSSNEDAIVNAAVDRWTDLLVTGKRLGSPCVSNWNNNFSGGMLEKFINKLEERGYRCDFIVTHCYWYNDWSTWKSWLNDMHNLFPGRQIWITEMNYGANWTGWPGSNTSASSSNYNIEKQHFAPIIDGLESTDYIERYAVYNDVQECRYMYNAYDASLSSSNYLTPMGVYYANKASNIGYKASYNTYVPSTVAYSTNLTNPVLSSVLINSQSDETTVKWTDSNGEYIKIMYVEKLVNGSWTVVHTFTDIYPESETHNYEAVVNGSDGGTFRIHTVDRCNVDHYSGELSSVTVEDKVGSKVTYNNITYYLGGNIIANGDFNYGWNGWTDGTGNNAPAKAKMEIIPVAGTDNGTYIRSYGNTGADGDCSLKGLFTIARNTNYQFSVWHKDNGGGWQKGSLSTDGNNETSEVLNLSKSTDWTKESTMFASGSYQQFILRYRWLDKAAKFDKFALRKLCTTERAAYDDGFSQLQNEAEVFKVWNASTNGYVDINTELTNRISTANSMSHNTTATAKTRYQAAENALQEAFDGVKTKKTLDSLLVLATTVLEEAHPAYSTLQTAIDNATSANTVSAYTTALEGLRNELNDYLVWADKTSLVQNPTFTASTGWTTKAGSYTGGDQRLNNIWGKTCWNAWWSTANAGTMEVKQTLTNLPMGYYSMSCVATTQPFCITDQHGYITGTNATETTPTLTFERFDAPGITNDDVWESLATKPVWVDDDGSLTIGFVGSKEGKETSNPVYSDNREGWWCATDFKLYYSPVYRRTGMEGQWGTVCLPFDAKTDNGVTLYEIAGINLRNTQIFLNEVNEITPGIPYIFYTENETANFYGTNGDIISNVSNGNNGLVGIFKNSKDLVKNGDYVLTNNKWNKVKDTETFELGNYHAYIPNLSAISVMNGTPSNLKRIDVVSYDKLLRGDINLDGEVNITDVVCLVNKVLQQEAEDIHLLIDDLNEDGNVNITDVIILVELITDN